MHSLSYQRILLQINTTLHKLLDRHVLHVVAQTDSVVVVRLHRPESRTYLVQITFTPEGIAIQGDFVPGGGGGLCCKERKSLGWFAGELSPDYLAEKFLTTGWQPEIIHEMWQDRLTEAAKEVAAEEAQALEDAELAGLGLEPCPIGGPSASADLVAKLEELLEPTLPGEFESPQSLRHRLDDLGIPWDFEDFGNDYSESEVADLAAIQRCFAKLWALRQPAAAAKE